MAHDETPPSTVRLRSRYCVPLFIIDLAFFGLTNPVHAHVWTLAVGGALAAVTIWATSLLFVRLLAHLLNISRHAQRLLGGIITVTGLYILGMQSLGQLNTRDALALVPLVAVFYFYVTYSRKAS